MYLMQRLEAPRKGKPGAVKPHHVFGGAGIGLSQAGWDWLDQLCTLSYMGAAEYEFGELPKFLRSWGQRAEHGRAHVFKLLPGEYQVSWERSWCRRRPKPLPPLQERVVYTLYLADAPRRTPLEDALRRVFRGEVYVKAGSRHQSALDPLTPHDDTKGWICLGEDGMAFVDEQMWRDFAAALGIDLAEVEVPVAAEKPHYAGMKKPELVAAAVAQGCFRTKSEALRTKKDDLIKLLGGG